MGIDKGKLDALLRGDARWEVVLGDSTVDLRALPPNSIDSIVCDPPYDLAFMGKTWDGTGVAFKPETWKEMLRVLKPGGHVIAFGGTRTYHRLACALEDAGFEIRDTLCWLYGQGFPKSMDVSKAIDKSMGIWRGKAGETTTENKAMSGPNYERTDKGEPITTTAKRWEGWGTCLKPAFEPAVLARKPMGEATVAENIFQYGTGGLNIDATRIPIPGGVSPATKRRESSAKSGICPVKDGSGADRTEASGQIENRSSPEAYLAPRPGEALGRFPANVVLSHHPECAFKGTKKVKGTPSGSFQREKTSRGLSGGGFGQERAEMRDPTELKKTGYASPDGTEEIENWECHPECVVRTLDEQSGVTKSAGGRTVKRSGGGNVGSGKASEKESSPDDPGFGDVGGASRFFYTAKASASEKWLYCRTCGTTVCKKTDIEKHKGHEVAQHPTVKPVALMRWLVRLVTPPGGLVLDPFMGSGSTGIACVMEEFRFLGFDKSAEYWRIAHDRIKDAEETEAEKK